MPAGCLTCRWPTTAPPPWRAQPPRGSSHLAPRGPPRQHPRGPAPAITISQRWCSGRLRERRHPRAQGQGQAQSLCSLYAIKMHAAAGSGPGLQRADIHHPTNICPDFRYPARCRAADCTLEQGPPGRPAALHPSVEHTPTAPEPSAQGKMPITYASRTWQTS